jgi:hypothetical protein
MNSKHKHIMRLQKARKLLAIQVDLGRGNNN